MESKKASAVLWSLIIVLLLVIAVGSYFIFSNGESSSESSENIVSDGESAGGESIVNKNENTNLEENGDASINQDSNEGSPSSKDSLCTDSDGEDYFTKGVVNYKTHEISDRCLYQQDTNYLIENICSDGIPDMIKIQCPSPSKCLEGVCIDSPENCFDSDGGLDYYVKGKVTAVGDESSTSGGFDYCVGDELSEKYCENDIIAVPPKKYICPNGCSDGACI